MPQEQPSSKSIFWKRRISPELGALAVGLLVVGILIWIYVVSAGIRDLRRHINAVDRTIDNQENRLNQLEVQVRPYRME